MNINIEIEILPFGTPNYVRTKKKGESETLDDSAIRLSDLTPRVLNDLCEEFTSEVFRKAGKQRLPTKG